MAPSNAGQPADIAEHVVSMTAKTRKYWCCCASVKLTVSTVCFQGPTADVAVSSFFFFKESNPVGEGEGEVQLGDDRTILSK